MSIKPTSPVGVALTGAQKLLASPTARKLIGEAAKAAGDIGVEVARAQVSGLARRISGGSAGPRGAGTGAALASLRPQERPLRMLASQLHREAQPVATQLVAQVAGELAAAATRAFAKATAPDSSEPATPSDESMPTSTPTHATSATETPGAP